MTDQEFADKQTKALCLLPPEFHGPLSQLAWDRGHSSGHDEVLTHLSDLADTLVDPVRALVARIKRESSPDRRF